MNKSKILKELSEKGYSIIENYITKEETDILKDKVDSLLNKLQNNFSNSYWSDDLQSDRRIYGIDNHDKIFKSLFENKVLDEICSEYLNKKTFYSFVMANKLVYKKGNLGSGGGWHRDTFKQKQLKYICYLSDVSEKNGPFQLDVNTHTIFNKLLSFIKKPRKNMRRYKNHNPSNPLDLVASRGTLMVIDTSALHRGRPIEAGSRYALTNYINDKPFSSSVSKRIYVQEH